MGLLLYVYMAFVIVQLCSAVGPKYVIVMVDHYWNMPPLWWINNEICHCYGGSILKYVIMVDQYWNMSLLWWIITEICHTYGGSILKYVIVMVDHYWNMSLWWIITEICHSYGGSILKYVTLMVDQYWNMPLLWWIITEMSLLWWINTEICHCYGGSVLKYILRCFYMPAFCVTFMDIICVAQFCLYFGVTCYNLFICWPCNLLYSTPLWCSWAHRITDSYIHSGRVSQTEQSVV